MNTDQITTRKQLQGYGATRYQTTIITRNLAPVARQGRAYVYALNNVIEAIRDYLQRSGIQLKNRQTLQAILQVLLERLGNVIEFPFSRGTNPKIDKLAKQLTQAMSNTDAVLAELKASAAAIKAKYGI